MKDLPILLVFNLESFLKDLVDPNKSYVKGKQYHWKN